MSSCIFKWKTSCILIKNLVYVFLHISDCWLINVSLTSLGRNDQLASWFSFSLKTLLKSWQCDICGGLYQTKMSSYILRSRYLCQDISGAQQYIVIVLFSHKTFFFFFKIAGTCNLDIAFKHIAILVTFWWIIQCYNEVK